MAPSEQNSPGDDAITGINMIPLVDIVLVLLIIFMVTATLLQSQSLHVNLPKAKTASASTATSLHVTLDQNGAMALNGQPTTESALQRLFHQRGREAVRPSIVIEADQGVAHGKVIHLIDMAREAGLSQFAFVVEKEVP